jgi:nucleoside-diphosphate-sugar epimerase
MKILISGSSGFLGKELIKHLRGCQIITIGRGIADVFCDLSVSIPKIPLVDLVVHAAAKVHSQPKTSAEKQAFFDVNLNGTQNLLKALENLNQLPNFIVFISSVAVYGQESGVNIAENEPLLAKDPYGLSKIQAEDLVENWCKKYNVICTILRLPLLVGINPPGNLGAMIKGIQKGYYFNISGGKAKKSMVLAEDIAEFLPIVAPIGGVYNLTDGYHPSFKELSEAIAKKKVFNLPLSVARLFGKIGDHIRGILPLDTVRIVKMTSDLTFDDTKARMVGWNPQRILDYLNNNDLKN